MNMPAKTKWLEEAKDHLIYYKIVLWWLMVFAPNKIHFSLFDRVVKARVQYMFGHLEMVVQMMIVTVMVMQPVCGQSPSILQQMMVRRLAMTSPVLPHSHPHSVMERVDTKTLEWSVYFTLKPYPMIKKSSQSEATIPMNCDPTYPLHGAILNLTVGIWQPFWILQHNGCHIPALWYKMVTIYPL